MQKIHYLFLLFRDQPEGLSIPVSQADADRLERILSDAGEANIDGAFFVTDTVDGKSFAINLSMVQVVRYLWEPAPLLPSSTATYDGVSICLRGREDLLVVDPPDDVDQLYDFFLDLESGADNVPFPSFVDDDGEVIQLNARDLVWVAAPKWALDAAAQAAADAEAADADPT